MQVHNIPNFQVQLPTTKIYVLRPSLGAHAININIYENNNLTGHIGARGYIGWETKPRTIVLEANGGVTSDRNIDFIKIEAQVGKTYYFKLTPKIMSVRLVDYSLEQISEQEGKKYISKLKQPKVKVVS